MNLILRRSEAREDGILGKLYDTNDNLIAYTLEHAYDSGHGNGSYEPKVPAGAYTCVRGTHRLASMTHSFVTFEIENVPGHTNILFHSGNTNDDSNGCVLLGAGCVEMQGRAFLTTSRKAFQAFIALQANLNEFQLTVINP